MKKKLFSLLLVVALVLSLTPTLALAASPNDELSATVTGYYQNSEKYVLDDWGELAAVYAYQSNGNYSNPVDLSAYVLPAMPTAGASEVFVSLMKGDIDAAKTAAAALVADGVLKAPNYASAQAMNMLALEAYNRSAAENKISYNKTAAITALLGMRNAAGGYGYSWDGVDYDDVDSAGYALTALSLYADSDYSGLSTAKKALVAWIKQKQNIAPQSCNANTTAAVLWGLTASGTDFSDWTYKPVDTLLSFYVPGGGFGYTDNASINAYATKQAMLALAERVSDKSFFTNILLNQNRYTKSVTMQVVKLDGSFVEKALSLTDADTLDAAVEKVTGAAVASGDYHCYKNGAVVTGLSDGDTILAVNKKYTTIAYFSANGSGLGVATPTVAFGGSAALTLKGFDGTNTVPLSAVPVDINGDTYGDVSTDSSGAFTVFPIAKKTTLTAIKSDYSGTHIGDSVAVLPAYISMASGDPQSKTVSVRVEGKDTNVLYYSSFDVTGDGSRRLTVYDAVTQALAAKTISCTATSGYISAIGGQSAGQSASAYDGWSYLYNGSGACTGMTAQPVSDGDTILVYYGYSLGYGTDFPTLSSSRNGNDLTLTVTSSGTEIANAAVTLTDVSNLGSTISGSTNSSGQVTFSNMAVGVYTVQLSKADTDGVPTVIRLAPGTTLTVTSGGASQNPGSGDTQTVKAIHTTVIGPTTTLYTRGSMPWRIGMTALDALRGTALPLIGNGTYVSSIGGCAEFDHGRNSGWKYKVNNVIPQASAADYVLSPGDELVWYYVTDYTLDSDYSSYKDTSIVISPTASVSGSVASVAVTNEQMAVAISAAEKSGGSVLTIAPTAVGSAAAVAVAIPKAAAQRIVSGSLSALTVETGWGSVTLPHDVLSSITSQAGGANITVSIQRKNAADVTDKAADTVGAVIVGITVESDGKPITTFGNNALELSFPVDESFVAGQHYKVVEISADGSSQSLTGKCILSGGKLAVVVKPTHLSTFVVTGQKALPFTDVAGHWALEAIQSAYDNALLSGVGGDRFSPDGKLNRAMLVTILYHLSGSPAVADGIPFSDIADGRWYSEAAVWAKKCGIADGYGGNLFGPLDDVTREQLATMLLRYSSYRKYDTTGANDLDAHADAADISSWALDAMKWANARGLITGRTATALVPLGSATRAETAVILMRYLQNVAK